MMFRLHGTQVNLRVGRDGALVHVELTPKGFDRACIAGFTLDYTDAADLAALDRACAAFNAELAQLKPAVAASDAA